VTLRRRSATEISSRSCLTNCATVSPRDQFEVGLAISNNDGLSVSAARGDHAADEWGLDSERSERAPVSGFSDEMPAEAWTYTVSAT